MGQLSLTPDKPKECKNTTIQFQWAPPFGAALWSVDILNNSDPSQAIIFHTTAVPPTSTVNWLVNVTAGVSLELVVAPTIVQELDTGATPSPLTTHFTVGAGQTSCIAPSPGTSPSSSAIISTAPDPSPTTSSEASAGMGGSVSATQIEKSSTFSGSSTHTDDDGTSTIQGGSGTSGTSASSTEQSSASATSFDPSPPTSTSGPPAAGESLSGSHSNSTSRSPTSRTIRIGAVVGSLALTALVILACCLLLRRKRARRTAAGAQALVVSPYPSYLSWLPHKSRLARSSYQTSQAESLCSDSQLSVSEVESKQPLAAWNPARFVGRRTSGESAAPPLRLPARAEQQLEAGLPSGTPATVASDEA